jgi:superfamily I DNA and/or RNA helicase
MLSELKTGQHGASLPDFRQLVKRSANLTFCTTSAGELEGLSSELSFDWTIVEEAGKVHGFDLALPLQAGHRWLLIGDHKQLPPYRDHDYHDAVDHLGRVIDALDQLPNSAAGLLDRDFIRGWRDRSSDEQEEFIGYCKHWLKVFEAIFDNCAFAVGGRADDRRKLTSNAEDKHTEDAAAAGMLSMQHRMHPDIGTLISEAYYDNDLTNHTLDESGKPLPRVTHNFAAPEGISGKAIVWLDTPWSPEGEGAGEWGPDSAVPRFINPGEAHALMRFLSQLKTANSSGPDDPLELALLSPYTQQVGYLQRQLRDFKLPPAVRFAERARQREGSVIPGAFTVDSFQGNQADIIAVSLVRNNKNLVKERGQSMGFLRDARRLNVLLSRPERLLILVGSWDFFEHQTQLVPLDEPNRELWHWKKVLTRVDEWVKEGRAVRLPADLADYQQPSVRSVLGSRSGRSRL